MASTLLEDHPAAGIFPMLDAESFEHLKADIQKHGQRDMVVLLDGQIIDGRNRYRACIELGIEPDVCELEECGDPVAYVLSTNLHRRHLLTSQKAMCAAKVATLPVGKPSNSANLQNYSTEQAAELFGVSVRTVLSARKIINDGCAELVALCEQGESVATGCQFIDACKGKKDQSSIAKQGWKAIADRAKQGKPAEPSQSKEIIADAKAKPGPVDTVGEAPPKPSSKPTDAGDGGEARSESTTTNRKGDQPAEEPPSPATQAKPEEPNTLGELFAKADAYLESLVAGRPLYARQALADHLESETLPRLRSAT